MFLATNSSTVGAFWSWANVASALSAVNKTISKKRRGIKIGDLWQARIDTQTAHEKQACNSRAFPIVLARGLQTPRVFPYGPEPYASADSAPRARNSGCYNAQA